FIALPVSGFCRVITLCLTFLKKNTMANISYNQIHETLDEATMDSILGYLNTIISLLPKGTLTAEERQRYRSLDVRNLVFVEDAVQVKNGAGGTMLPAVLHNDTIDTDLALHKQVKKARTLMQNLHVLLADVERIVAHEAYGTALTHYKIYQVAAKVGMEGGQAAMEKLEWRFKSHAGRGKRDENTL